MDLHLFNLEREDEGLLFTYWGNALLHTPRQKEDDSTSGKHEESLSSQCQQMLEGGAVHTGGARSSHEAYHCKSRYVCGELGGNA